MSPEDGHEAITMRGFNQMNHLVNDHVFEEVLRLRHKLCIEPDVPCPLVAAPPPGLHPLKEVPFYLNVQAHFPFLDERRENPMQERFVPIVHHSGALSRITAWADRKGDAPVVERNEWPGVPMDDGKKMPSPPEVMAFAFDEPARCFTGLGPEY